MGSRMIVESEDSHNAWLDKKLKERAG